jgi:DNA-binding response OmpR family regulator
MAKILVIDDEDRLRRMVRRILVGAGHDVIEAADGGEGMQRFASENPDVVISDILMPQKEGIETIKELRRQSATVWIVAMSGGGTSHNMMFLDFAKALGADAALAKPFRAEALLAAVARTGAAGRTRAAG